MDINKIAGIVETVKPSKQGRVEKGNTFAEVLDKTVNAIHDNPGPSEAPLPDSRVVPMACAASATANNLTIRRASNVLNLLESYAKALQDPKRTLKSIEPIVGQIREQIPGLKVQTPGQDRGLLKLVDQIAVTATVETLKFQRGDYVA